MRRVFADTSYWIALLNPRDELHVQAMDAASSASDQVVTSEMVLVEFLNAFSDRGPRLRRAAAQAVRSLQSTANVVSAIRRRRFSKRIIRSLGSPGWTHVIGAGRRC